MKQHKTPPQLRRHLVVVLMLKALALAVLWLLVVRDGRIPVDAGAMAGHAGLAPAATHPSQGEQP